MQTYREYGSEVKKINGLKGNNIQAGKKLRVK